MKSLLLKNYLERAVKEKFAIPAFNTLNMEFTQAIVGAAEQAKAPVIIQITESSIKYAGFNYIDQILKVADNSMYVFVHLDHGTSFQQIQQCLNSSSFSSVMIDRSTASFHDNIKDTRFVKNNSHHKLIEAELGVIGGKEEEIISETSIYTDINEAVEFVEATNVDLFAPAVGTAHGIYKETPKLNYELIDKLRNTLDVPLVLHGSSGLSDEQISLCIQAGMNKINIDTEIKQSFIRGFLQYMELHPKEYDLRKIFNFTKDQMIDLLVHKINICRATGKI